MSRLAAIVVYAERMGIALGISREVVHHLLTASVLLSTIADASCRVSSEPQRRATAATAWRAGAVGGRAADPQYVAAPRDVRRDARRDADVLEPYRHLSALDAWAIVDPSGQAALRWLPAWRRALRYGHGLRRGGVALTFPGRVTGRCSCWRAAPRRWRPCVIRLCMAGICGWRRGFVHRMVRGHSRMAPAALDDRLQRASTAATGLGGIDLHDRPVWTSNMAMQDPCRIHAESNAESYAESMQTSMQTRCRNLCAR